MNRAVRFTRFERGVRPGAVIEVLVRPASGIGKVTRFSIRRGRPPARADLCLRPASSRGSTCPTS